MGQLVKLISAVIKDVSWLFLFMILNIMMFALYYMALGYKLENDQKLSWEDYIYWNYFVESWSIATKGKKREV